MLWLHGGCAGLGAFWFLGFSSWWVAFLWFCVVWFLGCSWWLAVFSFLYGWCRMVLWCYSDLVIGLGLWFVFNFAWVRLLCRWLCLDLRFSGDLWLVFWVCGLRFSGDLQWFCGFPGFVVSWFWFWVCVAHL